MKKSIWKYILPIASLLYTQQLLAQDVINDDFVKKHLKTTRYDIDTNASAVILHEREDRRLLFDEHGKFRHHVMVTRVIKILKPDALNLCDVSIYFRKRDSLPIHGATYNLQGTEIVKTELKPDDVHMSNLMGGMSFCKFSMPQAKVGSVIGYYYEIEDSLMQRIYTWHIQGDHPKITTIYSIENQPMLLDYNESRHANTMPKKYASASKNLAATDDFSFSRIYDGGSNVKTIWVRRNVPAFAREPYVQNRENNKEAQEQYLIPGMAFSADGDNWTNLNEQFWVSNGLGALLKAEHDLFTPVIDSLVKPGMTDSEKAIAVYKYVRNSFARTKVGEQSSFIGIKNVWDARKGSAIEINTILTAMLIKAGVAAYPLLIATTDMPSLDDKIPVSERLNYQACAVMYNNNVLLLDASDKSYTAGILPLYCYNGFAWAAGDTGFSAVLDPIIIENKERFYTRLYDITDSGCKVEIKHKEGVIESQRLREKWAEGKSNIDDYIKKMKEKLPEGVFISSVSIENADDPDANLLVKMTGSWKLPDAGDVYYLPHNTSGVFSSNPLSATTRISPVEFPYRASYINDMAIDLPSYLEPDSSFKPVEFIYDSGALVYRRTANYMPEQNKMTITETMTMRRTKFEVSEYDALRKFFDKLVDDNSKTLVFKK